MATATHPVYPKPSPSPPRPPLSVLVVDDCPDTAETTAELLRLSGHRAATAGTGRAALDAAAAGLPDVALVDLGLPDLDGCELAGRLQELGRRGRPLLVAVTGYGTAADRRRTAAAGFDLHLTKPADPAALLQLLKRYARSLGR